MHLKKNIILILLCTAIFPCVVKAEDGYRLWLRYNKIPDQQAEIYRSQIKSIFINGKSETSKVIQKELETGLSGLLGTDVKRSKKIKDGTIMIGTPKGKPPILLSDNDLNKLEKDSYAIFSAKKSDKKNVFIT